ncbi:sugar porter family MFS transporter [Flectobacillus longus]|uniref:sugar porter family MFS transporter n=1 Tax=Flectobacillus longus TaxID=2984207 RepID=UPI0024B86729|nr:sugar porter family MFS transporter [Flectobacillus longus]MDI9881909.1 sugar porter family MFS transporter [Flectobacillus longus]
MNQNLKLVLWSLSAALGGFLFGFDTAVISGVEQTLQQLWNLDVFEHGLTVSIALIGTVLGSLLGGIPAQRYGRRFTLLLIAIFYLIASLGTAFAPNWSIFLVFRFLGGLGVGISSVVAPMYISEIAPPSKRGRLVAMFQFNVVLGILMAYLSNFLLSEVFTEAWRWMLGIQALPSILFIVTVLLIPESPRWLVLVKKDFQTAKTILETIDAQNAEKILAQIQENAQSQGESKFSLLWQPAYRRPLTLSVLFAVFNQVSGINAIIYFAPRIFEMSGLGKDSSLLSSAGIGLVNLLSTLLGIAIIDKFGRRALMRWGSIGLVVALVLVAQSFYFGGNSLWVPFYLFLFIGFFGFSQGAVIWVFIAEIFPNEVRAYGQALGSFTHWILAAIITFTFPYLAETLGGGITFSFFALMMVLQGFFAWKIMPETKGTSLENTDITVLAH